MLWDCVSKSVGTYGYGYSISEESFVKLFDDVSVADALLNKNPPKTESERIIFKIYETYKKPSNNRFLDEKDLIVPQELHIEL